MSATLPRIRSKGPARIGARSRRTTRTGTTSGAPPEQRAGVDARTLARELVREVSGEVRFSDASRALYASDLSLYRQVPIGVVIPKTNCDVEATLAACRRHGAPILGRGCGTSLLGQCCKRRRHARPLGMAGSFGYEAHKYDISMQVAERHLLPALRTAPDALVMADGFSCRSQVKQGAGRQALHTAQMIALAQRAQGRS